MGDYTGKLDLEKEAEKLEAAKVVAKARTYLRETTTGSSATADSLVPQTTASATAADSDKPPTNRSLLEIVESDCKLLAKKQADYANGADPWLNFRESAEFVSRVRGVKVNALDVAYMLLGLKVSRLKNLGTRAPSNESRLDTLQDLRGYSAIIQAMEEELHG